jgi:hypothetical protein
MVIMGMGNSSINLVFHHGSMLPHEHVTSLVRPVKLCARFHLSSATWAVKSTSKDQRWKGFVRSCSVTEFVIASDEKYGNKQVVSLTPRLYDYVLENVREPEVRIEECTLLPHLLFSVKKVHLAREYN